MRIPGEIVDKPGKPGEHVGIPGRLVDTCGDTWGYWEPVGIPGDIVGIPGDIEGIPGGLFE